MMQVKLKESSPAKINLFLKIINKRDDGYHNIRSGITLISLFDYVTAETNHKFEVKYTGRFAPRNNSFDDCIIAKFFNKFEVTKPNYKFTITKNIPTKSGLGSASSNLAAVIRILKKLGHNNFNGDYSKIGADVPFFINNSDSLVRGIGEIVINQLFPKYHFLLVKPKVDCSTKNMFNVINIKDIKFDLEQDVNEITENDNGNDFELFAKKTFNEIKVLLNYLNSLPNVVFTRLTGSGSCVFAAFESKEDAETNKIILRKKFPNLWSKVVENNFI